MATSPNYSWPEPDNTDLVKNGALAIRTMGNAIDTTMATMTPKSTYTAKGSIAAATGASTPANLSVGNNGETLVADSSTSTGLRYQAPVNVNPVINSAMQIAQRGTSISIAASTRAYTLDRWDTIVNANQASTVTRQATGDTTNLPNIQYALRFQRNSGQTGVGGIYVANSFETINSIPYAGKTVTFSFYARAGANYSAASSILNASLATGTGTDQAILGGYTGTLTPISSNVTLTTTWQRFTATAALSSSLNELAIYFAFTPTGTAGTNDYFEVTGVQLEVGSVATPFKTYAGTIQGELAACQRYYCRLQRDGASSSGRVFPMGSALSTTSVAVSVPFVQTMRTSPTAVEYASMRAYDGAGFITLTSITFGDASNSYASIALNASSGFTTYRPTWPALDSNGYIAFSAEL